MSSKTAMKKCPGVSYLQALKDGKDVSVTEGHDQVLIVTRGCIEGRPPLVALLKADKVMSFAKIQFIFPLKEFTG